MSMEDLELRQKCLPTYLVVDVSGSMQKHQDGLNRTLKKLHHTLANSPRVAEFAHMSIIAFSTMPWVVIEMVDMEYVTDMPEVLCNGMTNYGDAFDLIKQRIEADIPVLRSAGRAVLRPCVFFLTDGIPSDNEWKAAFDRLTDRSWSRRPHVITYGFGDASEAVLSKVATKAAFIADGTSDEDGALSRAISGLLNSLVASARAEEMMIPTETPGYKSINVEYMD